MKTHKHLILFALLATLPLSACGIFVDSESSSEAISSETVEESSETEQTTSENQGTSSSPASSSSQSQSSSERSSSSESSSNAASSSEPVQTYTIVWKDDTGKTLKTQNDYLPGDLPSYGTTNPSKQSTVSANYTFKGWSPDPVPVSGDATYTAVFTSSTRKYDITWLNDDDSPLRVDSVDYGLTPEYKDIPTKEDDAQYSYTFSHWDKTIVPVTGPATYKAVYNSVDKNIQYTITWKNADGTTLDTDTLNYGATPEYTGAEPTKASDSQYDYTFSGWTPGIGPVTGDETYTATFSRELKPASNKLPNKLYFSSNKGWTNVNAYAWEGAGGTGHQNHSWPGNAMTLFKTNEYGEKVYEISGLSNYEYIIFNDGSEQTVNIAATTLASDKNAFYLVQKNGEGKYTVGQWYESGARSLLTKGQNIFHAFDWPISTIIANLDDIADQGFNAIQTSPIQPVKDYHESYNDTHRNWWRFYQPVGLCIGNSTSNILFSTGDGAAELTALTEAATQKGIRIIVDVVVNHLAADSSKQNLYYQVAQFNPEIYNNQSQTLHNPGTYVGINYDSGSAYDYVHADAFPKDLNTANSTVQTTVYNFLKSLVDCGVTGFRFDAAKHIETKNDAGGGSTFWQNTLGAVCSYAESTYKKTIWSYGEIVNGAGPNRSYQQYLNDAWFYAVTAQPGWYDLSAENCVSWGESHDDYMSNPDGNNQDVRNATYKSLAQANADVNLLYFVRPQPDVLIRSGDIGYHPDWGWKNGQVLIANSR